MPRKAIIISDATRSKIHRTLSAADYPLTVAQIRERASVSDQTARAVLTELVESGNVTVDREHTPIRYQIRGELGAHTEVWSTLYDLILDRSAPGERMSYRVADELALVIMQMIEATGGQAQAALIDETHAREQVETRKRK